MIKKICNFFLNFILGVLILGLIIIIFALNTIYNKDYIINKLKENNFYERSYSDIFDDFENYTMQSGLDLSILDNLVSKEKVESDINSKIDSIYSGKKAEIETNSIKLELDSRINKALEENNRTPSNEEKESINKYEEVICDSYKSDILYGRDFYLNSSLELLRKVQIGVIIGIVAISIILLIINKSILQYIAFIGIDFVFSGVLFIIFKLLLENKVSHILILDSKFSNFVVNTLTESLDNIFKIGIYGVILGVLLIIIGNLGKLKKGIENRTV